MEQRHWRLSGPVKTPLIPLGDWCMWMDFITYDHGDLRWVFPEVTGDSPLQERMSRICGKIEDLAKSFGVQPGDAGSGLEYIKVNGFPLAGIFGRVDVSDISFRADLYFERNSALDQRWGPPWTVHAAVEVLESDSHDDSLVAVEEMSTTVQSEVDAVQEFESLVDWLIERSAAEDLDYWRAQADKAAR